MYNLLASFFLVSHPIREQVLYFLYWPHHVDKSSAAVVQYWREGRGTEGGNPLSILCPPILWLFFSLYVTITSSQDENNLIFTKPGRWNDSYVHHRQTCRDSTCQGPFNGAWMCTVSVHIVQMCINMWGSWFAKKRERNLNKIWACFWFDSEGNWQERKMSPGNTRAPAP